MIRRTPKEVAYDLAVIARLRLTGASTPPVARPHGERSLFIGPANSAGQGTAWARAAERADARIGATSMAFVSDARFAFPVDVAVSSGYAAHSARWQREQAVALRRFDAVLLESGTPLLAPRAGDALAQLRAVQAGGALAALLFHGSDIRDPDAHLAAEPLSHFGADPEFADTFRAVTARNRRFAAEAGVPVFVSTPDLLGEVPDSRWLPVVVDVDRWTAPRPPFADATNQGAAAGSPLRVVHIPSSSLVKGTELVDPMLRELDELGRIEYRTVTGIPHAEMPAAYRAADVVVDQFRVGNYGVAACEGLAAGRIVVSHVSEQVRARTLELTGEELPIVQATPETLEAVLTDIAADPERYLAIAERGPAFVRAHHDGRRSGAVLSEWLAGAGRSQTEGTTR